jgi:O-antigen/teichoic acid export membrane protein
MGLLTPLLARLPVPLRDRRNLDSFLGVSAYAGLEAATVFVLARALSPELFGQWMLFYTGFFLFDRVFQGFYGSALVRFLSGAETRAQEQEIVGSAWVSALAATAVMTALVQVAFVLGGSARVATGIRLFALWYPPIAFVRVPFLIALSIQQARGRFDRIVWLRLVGMGLFVLAISALLLSGRRLGRSEFTGTLALFAAANLVGSACALGAGWAEARLLRRATWSTLRKLADYGKYSMGTFFGSNILRDADVFLIGLFMRPEDVALYGVPLKLIDALNVPLAALVAVCFPNMARASQRGDLPTVNGMFYRYTAAATLLFVPLLLAMALMASPLVWLFGGSAYVASDVSSTVLRIFLVYGLFLAADRFIGVTLDSVNRPGKNLLKVAIMAAINVAGDLVAILVFHSLAAVAMVTVLNVLCGVAIGLWFLRAETGAVPTRIFRDGLVPLKGLLRRTACADG